VRRIKPAVWAPLLSLALVLWFVWRDAQQVSPGPLSAAHAQDPKLADQDCELCHGDDTSDRAGMARACAQCHEEIGAQLASKRGLHGRMQADAARCGACHSEHHGLQLALVSVATFERAGIQDPEHYDHAGLGYELAGRHLALDCAECHENSDVTVLERGKRRFLGESQACTSCHKDPHAGRLPDCKSCHGEERPFPEAPNFRHTASFPLAGEHAGLACVRCHAKPGEYSSVVRACAACHEDVHKGQFGARGCSECHGGGAWKPSLYDLAAHARSAFPLEQKHAAAKCADCHKERFAGTPRECAACHEDVHRGQFGARGCGECHRGDAWKPSLFDLAAHSRSAFPLEHGHATAKCADCHRERFAGTPRECAACHADVHKGQFGARGCRECHDSRAWKPSLYDLAAHARSAFPLEEKHATAKCADCHRERFAGTSRECAACHADVHAGSFREPTRGCTECHTQRDWMDARASFDHRRWTGFALEGRHLEAGCQACHTPRAPGRACAACHADPHVGQFARAGATDCARCHAGSDDFRAAGFDHQRDSRFALDATHKDLACDACHRSTPLKGGGSAVRYKPLGLLCGDCHDARR
jgi:hypothetical protein